MAPLNDAPGFEDAVTLGMNAVADGITRAMDTILLDDLRALVRRIGAALGLRPAPAAREDRLTRAA